MLFFTALYSATNSPHPASARVSNSKRTVDGWSELKSSASTVSRRTTNRSALALSIHRIEVLPAIRPVRQTDQSVAE